MGLEAKCVVKLGTSESMGKAHCGDGEIDFRGDFRFKWKWSELSKVEAASGVLYVNKAEEQAEFHLGEQAERWSQSILNPKGRLDKFGLKAGHRYRAIGEFDDQFKLELMDRAGESHETLLDVAFVRLDKAEDLLKLLGAKESVVQNGMIWAIWPKGRKEFREDDIRNFALKNGLVDVKVASFSEKLSALKLVVPKALRG